MAFPALAAPTFWVRTDSPELAKDDSASAACLPMSASTVSNSRSFLSGLRSALAGDRFEIRRRRVMRSASALSRPGATMLQQRVRLFRARTGMASRELAPRPPARGAVARERPYRLYKSRRSPRPIFRFTSSRKPNIFCSRLAGGNRSLFSRNKFSSPRRSSNIALPCRA